MAVHPRRCRFEEQPKALSPARNGEACRLLSGPAVELVVALKRKEPTAFEQLIAKHRTMLYRLALQLMALQQGIARLPKRNRPVCVLAEIEGLRHREIGAMLKLTVGSG